jgi:hypothetical protein
LERIFGILIGGFFSWLGFRLFLDVPAKTDSSGKFAFPGGGAIHLMRVGPGVFFALFGTGIVALSFIKPVKFREDKIVTLEGSPNMKQESHTDYSGAGPQPGSLLPTRQEERNSMRAQIAMLNRVVSQLKPDMDEGDRSMIKVRIPQVKLVLMEKVWGDDWGDLTTFKVWLNSSDTVPPIGVQAAAKYFGSR